MLAYINQSNAVFTNDEGDKLLAVIKGVNWDYKHLLQSDYLSSHTVYCDESFDVDKFQENVFNDYKNYYHSGNWFKTWGGFLPSDYEDPTFSDIKFGLDQMQITFCEFETKLWRGWWWEYCGATYLCNFSTQKVKIRDMYSYDIPKEIEEYASKYLDVESLGM